MNQLYPSIMISHDIDFDSYREWERLKWKQQDKEREDESERLLLAEEEKCEPRMASHQLFSSCDYACKEKHGITELCASVDRQKHFETDREWTGLLATLVHLLESRLTRSSLLVLLELSIPTLESVCACLRCASKRKRETRWLLRERLGGLRFGEMERDALLAYPEARKRWHS